MRAKRECRIFPRLQRAVKNGIGRRGGGVSAIILAAFSSPGTYVSGVKQMLNAPRFSLNNLTR
jgi:hypothetical protein